MNIQQQEIQERLLEPMLLTSKGAMGCPGALLNGGIPSTNIEKISEQDF